MLQIAKILRWGFALQALLYGSTVLFLLVDARRANPELAEPGLRAPTWIGLAVVMSVLSCMAVIFLIAWWALTKNLRSARTWALIASVLSLPLIPLGTIAGIAGFFVFPRRDTIQRLATPPKLKPAPIAGDGTHRALDAIAQGAAIAGTLAGSYFWSHWAARHGLPLTSFVGVLVQLELALFFGVVIHELGHVFGGWASHMKLRRFEAGPFDWHLRSGKWEFRFDRSKLFRSSGCTGMVPADLKNLRSRRVYLSASGPAASLLLGCVALIATLTAPGRFWAPAWQFCSLTALFSLLSFAINLIPMRPDDEYSDGAHIYQTITNGPWADVHTAIAIVGSSLVTPLRPRDFDLPQLTRATRFLTHNRQGLLLRLFAYTHCADTGQTQEALAWLAQAEAIYPLIADQVPADLHSEFVFANAFLKRDAASARLWWQRMEAKKITRFDSDYWRARAALAWIENRREDAREAWAHGNRVTQALPHAGAYDFDRDQYAKLLAAMDSPQPPPLPSPPWRWPDPRYDISPVATQRAHSGVRFLPASSS